MSLLGTGGLLFITGCCLGWQLCSISVHLVMLAVCVSFLLYSGVHNGEDRSAPKRLEVQRRLENEPSHDRLTEQERVMIFSKGLGQPGMEQQHSHTRAVGKLLPIPVTDQNRETATPHRPQKPLTKSKHQGLLPPGLLMNRAERDVVFAWLQDVDTAIPQDSLRMRTPSPTLAPCHGFTPPLTSKRLADHLSSPQGKSHRYQTRIDASDDSSSEDSVALSQPRTSFIPIKRTIVSHDSKRLGPNKMQKTDSDIHRIPLSPSIRGSTNLCAWQSGRDSSNAFRTFSTSSPDGCGLFTGRKTFPHPQLWVESPTVTIEGQASFSKQASAKLSHGKSFPIRQEDDNDIEDMAQVDRDTKCSGQTLERYLQDVPPENDKVEAWRSNITEEPPIHGGSVSCVTDYEESIRLVPSRMSAERARSISNERLLDLINKLNE